MNLNNKIRLTEDILLFENFLTEDESKKAIEVLDLQATNNTLTWMPISFYESYSSVIPQDNDPELAEIGLPFDFFSNVKKGIIKAVSYVHDIDESKLVQIGYHTQKWEPGAYATLHSDNTDTEGNSGPFARSKYAAFLYLNDDIEGGVLQFPSHNIVIPPKTGLLAAFAGGFDNMHEVTMITKGVRYTLGSFWDDKQEEEYPEEVRAQWKEEMQKIRDAQKIEKEEWQKILQDGYKIDQNGNKYPVKDLEK